MISSFHFLVLYPFIQTMIAVISLHIFYFLMIFPNKELIKLKKVYVMINISVRNTMFHFNNNCKFLMWSIVFFDIIYVFWSNCKQNAHSKTSKNKLFSVTHKTLQWFHQLFYLGVEGCLLEIVVTSLFFLFMASSIYF